MYLIVNEDNTKFFGLVHHKYGVFEILFNYSKKFIDFKESFKSNGVIQIYLISSKNYEKIYDVLKTFESREEDSLFSKIYDIELKEDSKFQKLIYDVLEHSKLIL
jgi:hypothetical protein